MKVWIDRIIEVLMVRQITGTRMWGFISMFRFASSGVIFVPFYLVMQNERRIERFLCGLEAELALYGAQFDRQEQRVSTVYVGGGTPTALSPTQLSYVLTKVAGHFSLIHDCEVTVEATPESLTSEYLDTLLKAGVTRLSIGIQTFDDHERTRLGLSSTSEEATAGIRLVKPAGFINFNLDLIYGIPEQSLSSVGQYASPDL